MNTLSPRCRPHWSGHHLNTGLWTAQALIAVSFCAAGMMKLAMPIPDLAAMWPWAGELPSTAVRLLGLIDFLGGAGVLLPSLTRIKPRLAVVAAGACIVLQLCAMAFHASRGEFPALPVNVVFIAVCAFIVWGRWKKVAVVARAPS